MSFFDKKEEVIDIQLTKYGKEKLANGVFKPFYYSFFDKDVIYDSQTFGTIELQNDIEERILQIPYPKALTTIEESKAERNVHNKFKLNNILGAAIGTSDPHSEYAPAWDISLISGEIESVETGSTLEYNKNGDNIIPQINLAPTKFTVSYEENYSLNLTLQPNESIVFTPKQNGDNSYIKTTTEELLISISEKNIIDIGENFEIEMFFVSNSKLEKLNFYKQRANQIDRMIVDDILTDDLVEGLSEDFTEEIQEIISQDVYQLEKYFNFLSDNQIPVEDINRLINLNANRLYIYDPVFGRGQSITNRGDGSGNNGNTGGGSGDGTGGDVGGTNASQGENC